MRSHAAFEQTGSNFVTEIDDGYLSVDPARTIHIYVNGFNAVSANSSDWGAQGSGRMSMAAGEIIYMPLPIPPNATITQIDIVAEVESGGDLDYILYKRRWDTTELSTLQSSNDSDDSGSVRINSWTGLDYTTGDGDHFFSLGFEANSAVCRVYAARVTLEIDKYNCLGQAY
jgi:hypothetical protein